MEDALTQAVLDYQAGTIPLDAVRNQILILSFEHLRRYRKKSEDEVSEFVLDFYDRIAGLVGRFRPQGRPFRHYLLRCLRWRWNTFRAVESRRRRLALLACDTGWGEWNADGPEPSAVAESPAEPVLDAVSRRRLVLLALKSSPFLDDAQLEEVSRQSGVDLAWLQACQNRLNVSAARRHDRWEVLVEKRSDAYRRRVQAEDEASREPDPARRQDLERRATMYRNRLESLTRQQRSLSTAPTHLEVARVVGMPKGSVDSGLYHLKRQLTSVYIGGHDHPRRHQQRPQED
jgi:hypothetical protein